MVKSNTQEVFLALLRAGLWEQEVRLKSYGEIDFQAILKLAEQQSVVGLVVAGIEHVVDVKPRKKDMLQFIGRMVQLEQRNHAMNNFICVMVDKLRIAGIDAVLVKGQGVAQCYERPLWRACGDVDLFLSDEKYEQAKAFLTPLAVSIEEEYVHEKHLGMTIDHWVVELHGRLYCGLSGRIERELDGVYRETFVTGDVMSWDINGVRVPQLSVENNVFYVFTHILQHFYKGGIGLRQICDWCRLLWTYSAVLNLAKLEGRLRRAGLMSEWLAFGAFAVNVLEMDAMMVPFYSNANKWKKKASRIRNFVLMAGNFGHNRDYSYFAKYPYLIRKSISFGRRLSDLSRHAKIFPLDSLRFSFVILRNGVRSAMRGE